MLTLSQRFPKKRAFITGAASGLGRSLALMLAADGWKLWLTDMRLEPLNDVVKEANAKGATAVALQLDVTQREAYRQVVDTVLQQAGGAVDVLINNAGVGAGGKMGEYSLEDWDWILSINLMGVVHGCHFFVDSFRKAQSGHIINVASAAAIAPVTSMAAYCTAKAAVKMLSEVLHNDLHDSHVDVTVVMPEFFQTNLGERTRGPEKAHALHLLQKAKYSADDVAALVLKRAGKRKLHVIFPPRTHLTWWLLRWFPVGSMGLVRKFEKMEQASFARKQAQ